MMAKQEQLDAAAAEARLLELLLKAADEQFNELEDLIGKEQAQIYARAQVSTLTDSQARAVQWVLFDQRRELLGALEIGQALQSLKRQFEQAADRENLRVKNIKESIPESERVKNAREYQKVAERVLQQRLISGEKKRFDEICFSRNLPILKDSQRRHYFRLAKDTQESF